MLNFSVHNLIGFLYLFSGGKDAREMKFENTLKGETGDHVLEFRPNILILVNEKCWWVKAVTKQVALMSSYNS